MIKYSAQLIYRNLPEVKPQGIAGNVQPMADPAGCTPVTEGYTPPVWLPTVKSSSSSSSSSPVAPLPNRDDEFNKNQLKTSGTSAFGQGQYSNTHLGNEFQYGDTAISPNNGSNTSNQLGSLPHCKQKSVPDDGSLSGNITVIGTGNMTAVATGLTNSNQLAVSDNSPVIAAVALPDQPTPETSQTLPTAESKFGKANLDYLKNRLEHKKQIIQTSQALPTADSKFGKANLDYLKSRLENKKQITQTVVQIGGTGSHPQSTDAYANYEISSQGISDSTARPIAGKPDLSNLRARLERAKEEREKTIVRKMHKGPEYYNVSEMLHVEENPVMIDNPPNKRPMAIPRTKPPGIVASNDTNSATSSSSSKSSGKYRLWQCAQCQTVNDVHHICCKHCKGDFHKMSKRSLFCVKCELMMLMPLEVVYGDKRCPICYQVYESAL